MRTFERLKFYSKMLLLNRRNTIIMFLGLGISLAMISEGLIFMYSFQYDAFDAFSKQTPTRQFTFTLDSFSTIGLEDTIVSEINNITWKAIEEVGMTDRIKRVDLLIDRGTLLYVGPKDNETGEEEILPDIGYYGIPDDYFSALESILYNGTLPYRADEVLLVAKQSIIDTTNLSRLGTFPVYVPIFTFPPDLYAAVDMGIPDGGNYVNITGVITQANFENFRGSLEDDFRSLETYFTDQYFLSRHKGVMDYTSRIGYLSGMVSFTSRFSFDLSKIDAFNVGGEITQLTTLGQELSRAFEKEGFNAIISPDLVDLLRDFNEEFIMFQLIGLLFTTPLIGMALSLTNYSTNLMKRKQKRQVSNMLQRGASRKEVVALLVVQVVEFTVVALLICFVIGYPFAALMIRSNGFLSFSGTSMFPAINMVIFYVIIGAAFIFSVMVNAKNVWDMSNISTEEAYGTTRQRKPLWERTYIDVVLIVVGIVLWLIVALQIKGTSAYSFAYGFGTTAPICLILGSILFITRIYPLFVNQIAKFGWKRPKIGIIGLSAKRSLRRKGSVMRSLVLISLTFTLIISSMATISSYQKFDSEQAYYQLGADILIKNVKVTNDGVKDRVLAIEGVDAGTYIKYTSQFTTYGAVTYSYIVLGIDIEEFSEVAYFERDYLGTKDALGYFSQIESGLDIVMQKDQMQAVGVKVGDDFKLTSNKYIIGDVNYTLNVVDDYKFFPRFFVEYPRSGSSIFRFTIVGNYNLTENLAYNAMNIGGDMLVKISEGYSTTEVASAIEEELGRRVDNVEDLMGTFEGSLRNTMLYGSLNTAFIASMVITIAAITLMILVQSIENEMEVVMLKTLGMSPKQLFTMFTTEAVTLLVFGSILGLGVGIFSAKMFMEILTLDTIIPSVELVLPPLQIFLAFGLLFFTAFGAAALTSWIIFRKDTIKGIKQI